MEVSLFSQHHDIASMRDTQDVGRGITDVFEHFSLDVCSTALFSELCDNALNQPLCVDNFRRIPFLPVTCSSDLNGLWACNRRRVEKAQPPKCGAKLFGPFDGQEC